MTKPFALRCAAIGDLGAISDVLVTTWRSTFKDLLPPTFLGAQSIDQQYERYRKRLERPDCSCVVACDRENQVFGFASAGPVRSSLLGAGQELYALYIRREWHRIGAGRALFSAIRTISLGERLGVWVLEVNPALQFYEHLAGTRVARDKIVLGHETFTEIGLSWPPVP